MQVVTSDELEAIKRRNPRLIFIIGPPGSGKSVQCSKLFSELKYTSISTGQLIREEILKKTKLGEFLASFTLKAELPPLDAVVSLLVRNIISKQGVNTFIISGFPRTLEQALYIEKKLMSINMIVNLNIGDTELLTRRILERGAKFQIEEDTKEEIVIKTLEEYSKHYLRIKSFYDQFGVIREINANNTANVIFRNIKQELMPKVYSINGKAYSGKTTHAKKLAEKIDSEYLDFNDYLKSEAVK